MKRLNKQILLLACGFFATSACNVMDTQPFESYSEDLVWSNESTADAFAVQTYNHSVALLTGSASWESRTPQGIQASQVGEGIDTYATETGINVYTDLGFNRFGGLRACNLLIEQAAASTVLSDQKKRELVAEGHFLRGVIFFDQARKMGRFVPITEVLTQDNEDAFHTPLTSSVEESYQYVISDLTKAAYEMVEESLPGRANRYAAHLIRSRAALQAYAYSGNTAFLDTCIVSANAVINSGRYSLATDYGSMFDNRSPIDNEIILGRYFLAEDFAFTSADELIRVFPNVGPSDTDKSMAEPAFKNVNGRTFVAWGTMFPTQDLVDQYLVIDQVTGEAKPWDQTTQFLENTEAIPTQTITTPGQIDGYTRTSGELRRIPSPQDLNTGRTDYPLLSKAYEMEGTDGGDISSLMYENRDKRFYGTIVHDNSTWLGEDVTTNLGGNISQGVRAQEDGGWYNTVSGYYWRKGTYDVDQAYAPTKTDYHYVVARLGEAYMNLAEAYLLKNEIGNAVNALNATRVAHGGLPPSTASSPEQAWQDYMRERRVEMAYENGDIYFSYLRWGKYGGYSNYQHAPGGIIEDLNRPVYKIQISRDRTKLLIGQITVLNSWNRNFTQRRYLFPIPQGHIDTRSAHGISDTQNPGW